MATAEELRRAVTPPAPPQNQLPALSGMNSAAALREAINVERGGLGSPRDFGRQFLSGVDDLPGLVSDKLQIPGAEQAQPTTFLGSAGRLAGQTAVAAPIMGVAGRGAACHWPCGCWSVSCCSRRYGGRYG